MKGGQVTVCVRKKPFCVPLWNGWKMEWLEGSESAVPGGGHRAFIPDEKRTNP
jgi:hypothetical protein